MTNKQTNTYDASSFHIASSAEHAIKYIPRPHFLTSRQGQGVYMHIMQQTWLFPRYGKKVKMVNLIIPINICSHLRCTIKTIACLLAYVREAPSGCDDFDFLFVIQRFFWQTHRGDKVICRERYVPREF